LKERNHWGDQYVDGRMVFREELKRNRVWGMDWFICFWTASRGGLLWTRQLTFGFLKRRCGHQFWLVLYRCLSLRSFNGWQIRDRRSRAPLQRNWHNSSLSKTSFSVPLSDSGVESCYILFST
jgi:hypothetical protein